MVSSASAVEVVEEEKGDAVSQFDPDHCLYKDLGRLSATRNTKQTLLNIERSSSEAFILSHWGVRRQQPSVVHLRLAVSRATSLVNPHAELNGCFFPRRIEGSRCCL